MYIMLFRQIDILFYSILVADVVALERKRGHDAIMVGGIVIAFLVVLIVFVSVLIYR